MRTYIIRIVEARPFHPFTLCFQGGHVIDVLSPEFITFEPGVMFATVYDPTGHRWYIEVDKLVAIRTIHPVEE